MEGAKALCSAVACARHSSIPSLEPCSGGSPSTGDVKKKEYKCNGQKWYIEKETGFLSPAMIS